MQKQLTESQLRLLIESSQALAEIIALADKVGPQGRTELLRILHERVNERERVGRWPYSEAGRRHARLS